MINQIITNEEIDKDAYVIRKDASNLLVNALGLKQVVDKSGGTWPSNYMSKASQLGITKVLDTVNGSADAIRGDIFLMAWETLLQDQWGAIGFNDLGEISYGKVVFLEEFHRISDLSPFLL